MRLLLRMLDPAVWRAYGAALGEREQTGAWPTAGRIRALADRYEADVWGLLVLTRAELPKLDEERHLTGELVAINDSHRWERPRVLAPTPDAMFATYLMADDLYAIVFDPWRREVGRRNLTAWAEDWRTAAARARAPGSRTQLAPVDLEPPDLPAQTAH